MVRTYPTGSLFTLRVELEGLPVGRVAVRYGHASYEVDGDGPGAGAGYGHGHGARNGYGYGGGYGTGYGDSHGTGSGYGRGYAHGKLAGYYVYLHPPFMLSIGCEQCMTQVWREQWREIAITHGVDPTDELKAEIDALCDLVEQGG